MKGSYRLCLDWLAINHVHCWCLYKDAWADTDGNTHQIQHMVTQFRARFWIKPIGFIFLSETEQIYQVVFWNFQTVGGATFRDNSSLRSGSAKRWAHHVLLFLCSSSNHLLSTCRGRSVALRGMIWHCFICLLVTLLVYVSSMSLEICLVHHCKPSLK